MFPSPTHAAAEVKDEINDGRKRICYIRGLDDGYGQYYLEPDCVWRGYGVGENLSKLKRNLLYLIE
ncbi:MAG TPA: hypothetical protein VM660_00110 [Bacillus sp. (in: firmicutes)]|nr:hypothetical protein [Bacillus sp. (in: firmicutes)]